MPGTPPRPEKNKPLDYYLDYLRKLAEDGKAFDLRVGYIRWLQGHAFIAAEQSKPKVKIDDLLKAADVPRSTYYAC